MYGAILGDIIGEPYEFDRGNKSKNFPLFSSRPAYTDDSVMTIAVAEALMNSRGKKPEETGADGEGEGLSTGKCRTSECLNF